MSDGAAPPPDVLIKEEQDDAASAAASATAASVTSRRLSVNTASAPGDTIDLMNSDQEEDLDDEDDDDEDEEEEEMDNENDDDEMDVEKEEENDKNEGEAAKQPDDTSPPHDDQGGEDADDEDDREEDEDDMDGKSSVAGGLSRKSSMNSLNRQDDTASAPPTPKPKKPFNPNHIPSKLFDNCITVKIPMEVTVDLKVAIHHTRKKRINSIYKRFPTLKAERDRKLQQQNEDKDENDSKKDGENKPIKKTKKRKKPIVLPDTLNKDQFANMIDYLEVKYARGVMVRDEYDEQPADGDGTPAKGADDASDEGHGSVYSGGSFLDDTDLQRDVAEQVMAQTTLTKLQVESLAARDGKDDDYRNPEDDAFFVNVGALEVDEENAYGENYDPVQEYKESVAAGGDKSNDKSDGAKATKKRKKPTPVTTASPTKKKKVAVEPTTGPPPPSPAVQAKKEAEKKANEEAIKKKNAAANKAKKLVDDNYQKVKESIKSMTEEELPLHPTKLKVSLTCPQGKNPGDSILFSNPHHPGQRLKVKVPKDCFAGGTFKVTVPVKPPPPELTPSGEPVDSNHFSREFQELLDDYSRTYDDWCAAQAEVDSNFTVFKEKQKKFDELVKEFPSNPVTPVDIPYLKKIVRRARQNKHKRSKTAAARKKDAASGNTSVTSSEPAANDTPVKDAESKSAPAPVPSISTPKSPVPAPKMVPAPAPAPVPAPAPAPASPPKDEYEEYTEQHTEQIGPDHIMDLPSTGMMFPTSQFDMAEFTPKLIP